MNMIRIAISMMSMIMMSIFNTGSTQDTVDISSAQRLLAPQISVSDSSISSQDVVSESSISKESSIQEKDIVKSMQSVSYSSAQTSISTQPTLVQPTPESKPKEVTKIIERYFNPLSNQSLYTTNRLDFAPPEIANNPLATWLGGWNQNNVTQVIADITSSATLDSKIATFVLYNIPGRDCGSYSAGGLADSNSYLNWINSVIGGLGDRKAILILEPDALASIDCLSSAQMVDRYNLLHQTVTVLKSSTNALVYVDAGHANWHSVEVMSDRLKQVAIDRADGFALNVSNFVDSTITQTYGDKLSKLLGGKTGYVVDTSRNGNGAHPNSTWCNPPGMALGRAPNINSSTSQHNADLWIKTPGESDGSCSGAPSAGEWYPQYAQDLISNKPR